MPVGAYELVLGVMLRRKHDRSACAEHDAARVHQIAQGIAKCVIVVLILDLKIAGQPASALRPILARLEVLNDSIFQMFCHIPFKR